MKYLTVKIEIEAASIAQEYAKAGDILVAIEAAGKGKVASAEFEGDKKVNPHPGVYPRQPNITINPSGPVYGRNGPSADSI